jgi:hypothetical protein
MARQGFGLEHHVGNILVVGVRLQLFHIYNCIIWFIPYMYMYMYRAWVPGGVDSSYTVYRWLYGLSITNIFCVNVKL